MRKLDHINNQEGQTVVEYILLMFVMVTVIISGMAKVKTWFLDGADNCTEQSASFICIMDKTFNQQFNSYGSMRRFVIRR